MNDVQKLIAEARTATMQMNYELAYQGGLVGRLADALEATTSQVEPATAAEVQSDREELAQLIYANDPAWGYVVVWDYGSTVATWGQLGDHEKALFLARADAVLAAGFSRPVGGEAVAN